MYKATKADNFINAAMKFKGQWYKWGGGHGGEMKKPGGVDCSGLVMQAGYKTDLNLVGTAASQQRMGRAVGMRQLKKGDLVFSGKPAYHVGIYIGRGKVLHAPRTGQRVGITSVSSFQNARRIFKGLGDDARKRLRELGAKFNRLDANDNGRLEKAEAKKPGALRQLDRQGAIDWKTVKATFTKRNVY